MTVKRATVAMNERSPRISVEQSECARLDERGRWHMTWQIHNLEKEAMTLRAAQMPHGKFKSEQRIFEKGIVVRAAGNAAIEFPVICQEAPGSVVDNAFLILQVEWLQSAWRIFVRFQVAFDEAAEPRTRTEMISAHRIGFSAQSPRARYDG